MDEYKVDLQEEDGKHKALKVVRECIRKRFIKLGSLTCCEVMQMLFFSSKEIK